MVVALVCTAAWATLSTGNFGAAIGAENDKDVVVVLHGLGRSKMAMWLLASRLEDAGYKVARVGYHSLQDTPKQIIADIEGQIDACCLGVSPKLHFVGHSLGGLLIRAYLKDHKVANLGRVVLIGTPNTGSTIVDNLRHKWWFQVLGPMARSLGTDAGSFPANIGQPDYPLGVIAGKRTSTLNDGLLPGDDDGLVSVESTKIAGMADFVVVESGHSAMRYDKSVARFVVSFLQTGKFDRR
ncbi:MAG: alpha/beta hydrolase [Alphaproteobacteria bacterium]|nr:alpha/beta hydrolase [Alphaproteobacteria bacterium]